MVELAVGYVSIVPETSQVGPGLQRAFNGAAPIADRAGRDSGNRFSNGLMGGLKKVGPALAGLAGVGGVAVAFKSVITTGNEFTSSMNTMRAVSTASAEDMKKVSAAARQLANDTSLPATSANDAAAAMVELSKGGFTVQQSMDAARGTLQLAAAAQIDAASAATIQSQALQAFGQNATYAGTAADILANAANASSAEIVDVASALQQSGTVANQFGLSMQDTAAAIAMMANAGIQGSDAGTLLKSALLALTDQGKPAQGAIDDLGLSVYDANGKFAGMSKLFGELKTASMGMTAEQYQAATATLFGSDAMRIAGIAAQQGSEGYDKMVDAMGRQGAAAEVAAARTEGLPGAWERFKNAVEDVSLSIYDSIQGPLTGALEAATGGVGGLLDSARDAGPAIGEFLSKMSNGIRGAYETLRDSGKLEEWGGRLKNLWNQIGAAIDDVGPIIMQFSAIAAKAAAAMGFAAWEGLLATLESTSEILNVAVVPALQILADIAGASEVATVGLIAAFMLFKTVPAVMGAVRGMFAPMVAQARAATTAVNGLAAANGAVVRASQTSSVTVGRFGSAIAHLGQQSPAIARMQSSFMNAATGANRFGRMAGTAAAAGTGLRVAGSGIAGIFGGPVGLGLTAAAIGGMAWMSSVQKQKAVTSEYEAALESMNEEQKHTADLLMKTRGAITDDVYSSLTKQVDDYRSSLESAAQADAKWTDNVADGVEWLFSGDSGNTSKKLDEAASQANAAAEAIDHLGFTSEQVALKIGGSAAQWDTFKSRLEGMGEGGRKAAADLQGQRDVLMDLQNIAKLTTPGISSMQEAMRLLSDDTASAADKTNALKAALDGLNPARSKGEALSQHNELMRNVADVTKEAADQTKGFGDSLGGVQGIIDGTTENGAALSDSIKDIVDATAAAKANNADMPAVYAKNAEAFKQMATQHGVDIGVIQAAADALGMSDLDLIIKSSGGDEVLQTMASVKKAFDETPGAKTVNLELGQVSEESATKLRELGYLVTDLPHEKITRIQVKDDTATSTLNAVVAALDAYDGKISIADLDLNKVPFDLKDQAALGQLAGLDRTMVSPEAGLTIDKLLQGKSISMAELTVLDQTTANPVVDMIIDAIMEKIRIVNEGLNNAATKRNAYIDVITRGEMGVAGRDPMISGPPAANGFVREYANGGIASYAKGAVKLDNPHIRQGSGAGVLGVSKAGPAVYAEGETEWEAFIPGAKSKRARALQLTSEVARRFGYALVSAKDGIQAFASGGIRSADFDQLAMGGFGASGPLTGATYNWGGINWGDCSAAMSAFARFAAGLPVWAGRFTTGSMAGALQQMGAMMGRGGSGDMRFGWKNGGPGGGHTAGTLPSGKNVEMGGSYGGGMYGGSVGADDPQFTDHAYFKIGPSWSDPGSDSGGFVIRPDGTIGRTGNGDYSATGSGDTQTPEQKIASSFSANLGNAANAAVQGQVTDALGVFGISDSPGWLGALSKYQEDNPIQEPSANERANGAKVTDPGMLLPAEGEDLGGTTPGQQAPALGFTPTGDAVKDAVKKALVDKGWADGPEWDATDWIFGKEAGWDPLATNASSGAFGLPQFNPSSGTLQQYLPDKNPDPGVQADAFERYIADRYGNSPLKAKEFHLNNGWYDEGGFLPPGQTLVTNNTGRPEPVLNPAQWAAIQDKSSQEPRGPLVQINNPVYASESEAVKRQRDYVSRQMMRAGGR